MVEPPSPPLGLEVTSFDNAHVALRWQQPLSSGGQPVSAFKIYRELASLAAPTPVLLATVPASQFEHSDTTIVAGASYRYFITAENTGAGESQRSASVSAVPVTVPLAPAAPTLVAKFKDSITVAWAAPASDGGAPVTRYILYVKTEHVSSYQQVYAGIALTFKLTSSQFPAVLRPGFEYQFKVRAVNAAGEGPLSTASVPLLAAEVPQAPRRLRLVSRSATALEIRWDPPSDTGGVQLLGYSVYVAVGDAAYQQVVAAASTSDPTKLTHIHTGTALTSGAAYRFRVAARNVIGESPEAQLKTALTLEGDSYDYVLAADLPEAPVGPPTITAFTETTISISLTPIGAGLNGGTAVTGYLVEIDDGLGGTTAAPGSRNFRRVQDSLATSLIVSGLVGGRTYAIKYAARNLVYDSGNMFEGDALQWSPVAY